MEAYDTMWWPYCTLSNGCAWLWQFTECCNLKKNWPKCFLYLLNEHVYLIQWYQPIRGEETSSVFGGSGMTFLWPIKVPWLQLLMNFSKAGNPWKVHLQNKFKVEARDIKRLPKMADSYHLTGHMTMRGEAWLFLEATVLLVYLSKDSMYPSLKFLTAVRYNQHTFCMMWEFGDHLSNNVKVTVYSQLLSKISGLSLLRIFC